MLLKSIKAKNILPILRFDVENLSDVVVLAGRNGVGKTRLLQALINGFQNPVGQKNIQYIIEATNDEERSKWGKSILDTGIPQDAQLLQSTLHENRFRRNWRGSVINIESDRSIQKINPYAFTFDAVDPDKEQIGWNFMLGGMRSRHQDTLHSIFRKVHAHRNKISTLAEKLIREGKSSMELNFPDPLEKFKHAFRRLLAPKELLDADLQSQQLKYSIGEQELLLNTLSSGEREVVNIVFDFILRNPSDCIVFFDEPEIHLHPELSYKLIQTLTSLGDNNQFIFCTHSPDIITASLEHSVIFVAPPQDANTNQAITVSEDDETNRALKLLGQSVGVIALGKKIVLIEGEHASLDKQTYGAILKDNFPELVLVPSGGKGLIKSFSLLLKEVLEKSIWGVEFFMLCDRDVIPLSKTEAELGNGRFQTIRKYHLENYFLDADVISKVFQNIEPEGSWLRSSESINDKLKEIAKEMVSYSVALYATAYFREQVGNIDLMPKDCHKKTKEELVALILAKSELELQRVGHSMTPDVISNYVNDTAQKLEESVGNGDGWKDLIPGKRILNVFASKANISVGRLKRAYIVEAAKVENNPFQDIIDIFSDFNSME
ncbi:MAG: ATP-binding protein [Cycloclasticus sp.]